MAYRRTVPDRIQSAVLAAAVHLALGYALVAGLEIDLAPARTTALKLFDIRETPPPPPEPPAPADAEAPDEAAPPDLTAEAAAIVVPDPIVLPPILLRLFAAETPGTGGEASQGAAAVAGAGTGGGGEGNGTGGGGVAVGSHRIAGDITDADYPEAAARSRAGGTVLVRYTVTPDGRATGCFSTRSSGNAELDHATCRLIERRFRFEPARNAAGEPVADVRYWEQRWWLERRR